MAINKVEANGETLIDLTNDTAEAEDVLEGQTFHLRSGAIATGTYRPSDEIEAYQKATVGHSSKNLFDRQIRQGTAANTTTTSAVCSTTIIKTTNGATHRFKCFDNNFVFRVYGLNEAGAQQILSGSGVTTANRLFDSNYIFSDTYEHTNDNTNIVAYAIMLRKTSTQGEEDWVNFTPSDVPDNIIMAVKSPLTIDTFEPYVTPTDEKKQDKPVVLWEGDETNNLTVSVGDNSYYSYYILTGISQVKTDSYAEEEAPAIFTAIIHSNMPGSYCAPFYDVYAILTISYQSLQGVTNMVINNPKNLTLKKIVGIPK